MTTRIEIYQVKYKAIGRHAWAKCHIHFSHVYTFISHVILLKISQFHMKSMQNETAFQSAKREPLQYDSRVRTCPIPKLSDPVLCCPTCTSYFRGCHWTAWSLSLVIISSPTRFPFMRVMYLWATYGFDTTDENGIEKRLLTGAAFVDLPAAYDTFNNHRILYSKLLSTNKDLRLTQHPSLLRGFGGNGSSLRKQKNVLPQGGVFASIFAPTTNQLTREQDVSSIVMICA